MALHLQYNITEINDRFLQMAIKDLADRFRRVNKVYKKFNEDAAIKIASAKAYDPIREEMREYEYPLAKHLQTLFVFITSSTASMDVEEAINELEEVFIRNPMYSDLNYKLDNSQFRNTRPGFIHFMAKLKMDLLTGSSFSAQQTGFMCGVTGQAITNRIKRDSDWLTAEKVGHQFVIDNETVRKLVRESDSPLLGESSANQPNKKTKEYA